MATSLKNLSSYKSDDIPSGNGKKVGIVWSEWNEDITEALLKGCIDTLLKYSIGDENIFVKSVPGSFELPLAAQQIMEEEHVDGVVCIGCVIKGETKHDEYINHAVAKGIMDLNLKYNRPFIFGVLTPNTHQQAVDRAGGKYGNKGVEAAVTLLKMM